MLYSPITSRLLPRAEHDEVAVLVAKIDLAIGREGRGPDGGEGVVRPVVLACLGVERVQEARQTGDVDDAILNSRGRHGAIEIFTPAVPHDMGVGDVPGARCVDDPKVSLCLAMLGILANADIHLVVIDNRS